MSDAATPEKKSSAGPISLGTVFSVLAGLASSALGAGWPGVIALGGMGLVLGIGMPSIYSYFIKQWNARTDKRDHENAGADAGKTAVDLANQGHDVRVGLDELQKLNPPQKPGA